ncbi:unnamed protein product [Medioppia subpectinata]|uniref:DnaJ homolog subfamily B member 9 n=1 Tax=Medioppia subpectinata TaxID=1979941 RepID=A0A7R9KCB8_9ACAR|nr:unnamed protein product [Medioppia subpectinata]CAG2100576.1 unnamed protein product [Medioppia subpectinata]
MHIKWSNVSVCGLVVMVWICDNVSRVVSAKDYYQLLGVGRDATDREIKKAFRKLAVVYHPDKNKAKDAEDKFRDIAKAYEVLSDADKRRRYDQFGDEGDGAGSGGQHFNFNDFFKDFDQHFSFHSHENQRHNSAGGGGGGHHFASDDHHFGGGHHNRGRQHSHSQFGFNFDDMFDDFDSAEFGSSFGDFFGGHHESADSFGDGDSFFGGHHMNGIRMNSFQSQSSGGGGGGHGQKCHTVTKRTGNSVMTYTQCS